MTYEDRRAYRGHKDQVLKDGKRRLKGGGGVMRLCLACITTLMNLLKNQIRVPQCDWTHVDTC